jgi:hypothetical protein
MERLTALEFVKENRGLFITSPAVTGGKLPGNGFEKQGLSG